MAVQCDACAKPVSAQTSQCPHCGARRTAPGLGKLSSDEAFALLAMGERGGGAGHHGMFATLVLPDDRSHGKAQLAQVALTAFAIPVIAAGAPMVLVSHWRNRRAAHAETGEWAPVLKIAVFGGPAVGALLKLFGLVAVIAFPLVIAMTLGLFVRAAIRQRIRAARSRALARLDEPAALPVARVNAAPTTSSPRLAPLAAASPDRAPAAHAPGDEPRLLR